MLCFFSKNTCIHAVDPTDLTCRDTFIIWPETGSVGAGSSVCTCAVGNELVENMCAPCEVGFAKSNIGDGPCVKCDIDVTGIIGSVLCETCKDGTFANTQSTCTPCPLTFDMLHEYIDDVLTIREPSIKPGNLFGQDYSYAAISYFYTLKCPDTPGAYLEDFLVPLLACPTGQERNLQGTQCVNCEEGKYKDREDDKQTQTYFSCSEVQSCSGNQYASEQATTSTDNTCADDLFVHRYVKWCYPYIISSNEISFTTHRDMQFDSCKQCIGHDLFGSSVVDIVEELWRDNRYSVSILAQESTQECLYDCNAGFWYNQDKFDCEACEPGKYKSQRGTMFCENCVAGTYAQSGGTDCLYCPSGKYSEYGASECIMCCEIGVTYASPHVCYGLIATHFILGSCGIGSRSPNTFQCPITNTNTEQKQWTFYGTRHCATPCDTGEYYNYDVKGCIQCPGASSVNVVSWSANEEEECKPLCKAGTYLSVTEQPIQNFPLYFPLYECKMCSYSETYLQAACSDSENYFLDINTCTATDNTQCVSCSSIMGVFQEQTKPGVTLGKERCNSVCTSRSIAVSVRTENTHRELHVYSVEQASILLQLNTSSISSYLTVNGFGEALCILSEIARGSSCERGYAEVKIEPINILDDTWTTPAESGLIAWPVITCSQTTNTECSNMGGIFYRENTQQQHIKCHCTFSFYGEYDSMYNLQKCHRCPSGSTSLPGTKSIMGCYCDAGFARIDGVCRMCSSNIDGNTKYCPGGFVSVNTATTLVNLVFTETLIMLYTKPCSVCDCPDGTYTTTSYASRLEHCKIPVNMYLDSATQHIKLCDDTVFNNTKITQFLRGTLPCFRKCMYPGAVMSATGGCICDTVNGYVFDIISAQCVCADGWFFEIEKQMCTKCPANHYCMNQMRIPCLPQMVAPVGATMIENCTCLPMFYRFTANSMFCLLCPSGHKCNGVDKEICLSSEDCSEVGTYIPRACEPGLIMQNSECRSMVTNNKLLLNSVQSPTDSDAFYSVKNPLLRDVIQTDVFSVLGDGIRFVSSLQQIICPSNHVIVARFTGEIKGYTEPMFLCSNTSTYGGLYLVNTVLPTPPVQTVGYEGFIDQNSDPDSRVISDISHHLMWNMALTCTENPFDVIDVGTSNTEVDACYSCPATSGSVLGVILRHIDDVVMQTDSNIDTTVEFISALQPGGYIYWTETILDTLVYLRVTRYHVVPNSHGDIEFSIISNHAILKTLRHKISSDLFGDIFSVFAIPYWKYNSTSVGTAILAACVYDNFKYSDIVVLHFFDITRNSLETSEVGCIACCSDITSFRDIHFDISSNMLFIVVAGRVHNITLGPQFYHTSHIGYWKTHVQFNTTTTGDIARVGERWLSLKPAYTYTNSQQNKYGRILNFFYILVKRQVHTLCIAVYIDDNWEMMDVVDIHSIMPVFINNHNPVFMQSILHSINPNNIEIVSFSVLTVQDLNNNRELQVSQKMDILLLICTDDEDLDLRLCSILLISVSRDSQTHEYTVNNGTVVSNSVLKNSDIVLRMDYVFKPVEIHETYPNIIYVTGRVLVYVHDTVKVTVKEYQFTCGGCYDNEFFSAQYGTCTCLPGYVEICVPCLHDCDYNSRLSVTPTSTCLIPETQATESFLYNIQCVPCGGQLVCPTGLNADLTTCAYGKGLVVSESSNMQEQCQCPVGFSASTQLYLAQTAEYDRTPDEIIQKTQTRENCIACSKGRICNEFYSVYDIELQCPDFTNYTTTLNVIGSEYKYTQKCTCIEGYQNIKTHNIATFTNTLHPLLSAYDWNISLPHMTAQLHVSTDVAVDLQTLLRVFPIVIHSIRTRMCYDTKCTQEITYDELQTRFECITNSSTIELDIDVTNTPAQQQCIDGYIISKLTIETPSFLIASQLRYEVNMEPSLYITPIKYPDTGISQPVLLNFTRVTLFRNIKTARANNSLLFRRVEYDILADTCVPCKVGFFCVSGQAYTCPENSISAPKSFNISYCTCEPGFFKNSIGLCEPCPVGFLCFGGGEVISCNTSGPLHVKCPCEQLGYYRDDTTKKCIKCIAGFYCPYTNLTNNVHPSLITTSIKCPVFSMSLPQSHHISNCMCKAGMFLQTNNNECAICPKNTFCPENSQHYVSCPPKTYSAPGSSQVQECLCESANTVSIYINDTLECMCRAGFTNDTSSGVCGRCPGFPANTTTVDGGICTCAPGFFKPGIGSMNKYLLENSSNTDGIDHPLSSEYNRVLHIYMTEFEWILSTDEYKHRHECIPCPPVFSCSGGVGSYPQYINTSSSMYTIFPVGQSALNQWISCPEHTDMSSAKKIQSFGVSSCFVSAQLWSNVYDEIEDIYMTLFPGIIYFSQTQNKEYITAVINRDTFVIQDVLLFTATSKISVGHMEEYSAYYVLAEINTVQVAVTMHSQLTLLFQQYTKHLSMLDMGTGAGFSSIIPTLWALSVNEKISPGMLGEAIIVIPGFVKNMITERAVSDTIAFISNTLGKNTPRFVMLFDHTQFIYGDIDYNAFRNTLQYVHSNVCSSENTARMHGVCTRTHETLAVSTYTTLQVVGLTGGVYGHIQAPEYEGDLRLHFQLQRTTYPVLKKSCPPHMFRLLSTSVSAHVVTCVACARGYYASTFQCTQCTETTTQDCEIYSNGRRQLIPCTFKTDTSCVQCPSNTGCPRTEEGGKVERCGNGIIDVFSMEQCDYNYVSKCCNKQCQLDCLD